MLLPRFKRWLTRVAPISTDPTAKEPLDLVELRLDDPRPWVGSYPDVPAPEPKQSLQMFVARFVCGDIYGEDTPSLAADLLESGYDTPSLRRLAGETRVHCNADADELMDRISREAGLPVPFPLRHARMLVARQIARKVIVRECDLWSGVRDLKDVWGWREQTEIEDVNAILRAADEFVWDPEEQRYRPVVDADLLDTFARLARLTDAQCLA